MENKTRSRVMLGDHAVQRDRIVGYGLRLRKARR